MWPISAADSRAPRQSLPFWTKPPPMPGAHQDAHRALGLAGRAQPLLAQRAQVAVVAHGHGQLEALLQVRPDVHAREAHVGRDDDAALVRIDHAGNGHADGREVDPGPVLAARARSPIAVSIAASTFSGPPSRGVAQRWRADDRPDSSTSEAWIFVPPTSIPR